MTDTMTLFLFPTPLRTAGDTATWDVVADGGLTATAGAGTDLFVDPAGDPPALNAPRLLAAPPDGDFQFSARVALDVAGAGDAGVVGLWAGDALGAELCFEAGRARERMVVSVGARGVSDEADGVTIGAGA